MLARMGVTTALVVGLTSAAEALGPEVSGATASFPLIGASIAGFVQLSNGPAAGVSVMCGMAAALYAFAVFFLVAGTAPSALRRRPLATQGATLRFVRPHEKSDTAGQEAASVS